jgi:hypothetical protein
MGGTDGTHASTTAYRENDSDNDTVDSHGLAENNGDKVLGSAVCVVVEVHKGCQ